MVDEKVYSNQVLSHRMLNYLNAGLQGFYAFDNILSQLGSKFFSKKRLDDTNKIIARIEEFTTSLYSGNVFFDLSLGRQQKQEVEEVRSYLKILKDNVLSFSDMILATLREPDLSKDPELTFFLLAAQGRNLYGKDNYIRGFIEFARIFNETDARTFWEKELEIATAELNRNTEKITFTKKAFPTNSNFFFQLHFESLTLPGIFRAQAHDIYQLLNLGIGEFSFPAAKIEANNARLWERYEFTAEVAGYWQAYGFTPEQADEWIKADFTEPLTACSWSVIKFSPKEAKEWFNKRIPPFIAMFWRNANYSPDEAYEFIKNGEDFPSQSNRKDY